jgi:uncharacterized protein YecE (DUF72 family)
MTIRLGCQGWNYPDWIGSLYPERTKAADLLRTYARAFGTVEIDSTFYALPTEKVLRGWAEKVPRGFLFSPKLPQAITHEAGLRVPDAVLDEAFDRFRALGDALGIVLVQLPPGLAPTEFGALADFLARLPRDVRVAVEFRQKGWITRDVHQLCADHGVAIALSDGRWVPRRWLLQLAERPTADFAYVRWMGPDRSLTRFHAVQRDVSAVLEAWVPALAALAARVGLVLGYCNNHFAGHAPATIRDLQRRLGQPVVEPEALRDQPTLF